jgi:hypothetical protein
MKQRMGCRSGQKLRTTEYRRKLRGEKIVRTVQMSDIAFDRPVWAGVVFWQCWTSRLKEVEDDRR